MHIVLIGDKKENYSNFINVYDQVAFIDPNSENIDTTIIPLLKKDQHIIIADIDSINQNIIEKLQNAMNKKNIFMKLSGIKDWDTIINTFLKGQLFYLKPLQPKDFSCLFEN